MAQAQYWTYEHMSEGLKHWQQEYPEHIVVEPLGKSRMGRTLWVAILSGDVKTYAHHPAILVDANIHAGEVAGNAVAMHWIGTLLEGYASAPAIRELLDTRTVYVVPRLAVDGAQEYLTSAARLRSSPHLYPLDEPLPGWVLDDVDSNGHILSIRMPSADGAFAVDEIQPQLMRPRRPGEFGGQYYHVFPEGRVMPAARQGGGLPQSQLKLSTRQGMDFNRNFPIRWAGEDAQKGAGPFPLSEPELYALAGFVEKHPNIAAYVALHTAGGVILRQPSTGADTVLSLEDRRLYTRMGEEGARVSGYFAKSNFETFHNGHDSVLMPGAADDWMYEHQGALAFTVEIWDLPRHAGARGYAEYGIKHLMALSDEERREDMRRVFNFVEEKIGPQGYFPWAPFEHPDLGMVEIGGLDPKFVVQNPPLGFLQEECERVGRFLTTLGLSTALLEAGPARAEKIGENTYRVTAMIKNQGFLPTSGTHWGGGMKRVAPVQAELSGNFAMVAGESPQRLGHLDGYGSLDQQSPPAANRHTVEWVITAAPGTQISVNFFAPRAGRVQVPLTLS